MTRTYKGFTLYHCYCGFPKRAWVIFWGNSYKGVGKSLKESKEIVNEIIEVNKEWYEERTKAMRRIERNLCF